MSYKKKFKKYMTENFSPRDRYDTISHQIGGLLQEQPEEKKMKKKGLFASLGILTVAAAVVVGFVVLRPKNTIEPTAMVTMDVNPSITFTLDKNQRVISVNGENDEGKMVIAGEKIIGKDIESAIEIVIDAQSKTGFLVSGSAEVNENAITFSISVDGSETVENLKNAISQKVNEACDRLNIEEKIEYAEAYTHAQLEEIALAINPSLDPEEAAKMSYDQLMAIIAKHHLETAELYSTELVELYQSAKDYKIQFAEKEEIKNVIHAANRIYQTLLSGYQVILDSLQAAIEQLEQIRYDLFIAPESQYQQAFAELKAKKADVLALRNELAALDPIKDTAQIVELKTRLTVAETALATAETALETYRETAYQFIDEQKECIQSVLNDLTALEEKLPSEITDILEAKTQAMEKNLNQVKNRFFEEFEKNYSDDIEQAKANVLAWKKQLEERIAGK